MKEFSYSSECSKHNDTKRGGEGRGGGGGGVLFASEVRVSTSDVKNFFFRRRGLRVCYQPQFVMIGMENKASLPREGRWHRSFSDACFCSLWTRVQTRRREAEEQTRTSFNETYLTANMTSNIFCYITDLTATYNFVCLGETVRWSTRSPFDSHCPIKNTHELSRVLSENCPAHGTAVRTHTLLSNPGDEKRGAVIYRTRYLAFKE